MVVFGLFLYVIIGAALSSIYLYYYAKQETRVQGFKYMPDGDDMIAIALIGFLWPVLAPVVFGFMYVKYKLYSEGWPSSNEHKCD